MDWDMIMRLAAAVVLGAAIGVERERMHRAAGLKTHVLVSVGSALFTIVSINGFFVIGRVNDPARVAAQVVSGIGFLGAGTIMRQGATVRGLTTAASLWVVAGIGTACGAGQYQAASVTTFFVLLSVFSFRAIERLMGEREHSEIDMLIDNTPGHLDAVQTVLKEQRIILTNLSMDVADKDLNLHMNVIVPKDLDRAHFVQRMHEVGARRVEL